MSEEEKNTAPKKRRFRFWKFIASIYLYALAGVLLSVIAAAAVGFIIYDQVVQPGVPGEAVTFTVPEGVTVRGIGELLAEQDLIEYEGFFRLALKVDRSDKTIQHGQYELSHGLSTLQLLHILYEGPARHATANQYKVTIPEGLSLYQIAQLEDFDAALLDELVRKEATLQRLGIPGPTIEGFLMPNTYFFDAKPTTADLVERMLKQFDTEYAALLAEIPGAKHYDRLEVLTVASLVEEEARSDEERATVAAVIWNRLDKRMPLQMDSTLQFALKKYGQRMLYEDKDVDSPYNTYKHNGLPPGPISNPGVASIRAALQPEDCEYLYFVSNADGKTHSFSRTASEHERAVARYRKEIAAQRRTLNQ